MSDDQERSGSGAPIHRHAERTTPFTIPASFADHCEEITGHKVPEGHEKFARVELMVALPRDWLEKQDIDFVLDTRRPNVALKRGWFKW